MAFSGLIVVNKKKTKNLFAHFIRFANSNVAQRVNYLNAFILFESQFENAAGEPIWRLTRAHQAKTNSKTKLIKLNDFNVV